MKLLKCCFHLLLLLMKVSVLSKLQHYLSYKQTIVKIKCKLKCNYSDWPTRSELKQGLNVNKPMNFNLCKTQLFCFSMYTCLHCQYVEFCQKLFEGQDTWKNSSEMFCSFFTKVHFKSRWDSTLQPWEVPHSINKYTVYL